jgi:hypothetical protein
MRARRVGSPRLTRSAAEPAGARPRPPSARAIGRLPLLASFVPDPDVWRISGAGRSLLARRRADGRVAWASVAFDLKRPFEVKLVGNLDTDEGVFEEILDALFQIEDAAPMIGGSDTLASRFAHGAVAYSHEGDPHAEKSPDLLAVFERNGATDRAILAAFAGPEGVCPPDLLIACREEAAAGLAPGVWLAVHVALGFRVAKESPLRERLVRDADFERMRDGSFTWKPSAFGGARLGSLAWLDGEVEAETVSLELAGRLCGRIKRLAEGGVELVRLARRPMEAA